MTQRESSAQITEIGAMLKQLPDSKREAITNQMLGMCFMALAEMTKHEAKNEGEKHAKRMD